MLITDEPLVKLGHRLLCLFFSAYDFETLYRDLDPRTRDPDPLDDLRKFEDSEIQETLLTLAALARACDDQYGHLESGNSIFPQGVGTLTTRKGTKSLTLREACNKLIHAKFIKFDLARDNRNVIWDNWYRNKGYTVTGDYKVPAVIVEGCRSNGDTWQARINIVPFVFGVSLGNIASWDFNV
jgi:hypothetical protein